VTDDSEGNRIFRVGIPSWRQDLYRPIDLVEEVIRMYGSDRIPEATVKATVTLAEDDPVPVYERAAAAVMTGKGFQEAVHYTLRSEQELRLWYGHVHADALAVANPLASDASHLRTSVVPGLLDCLKLNLARHNRVERLFECGRVFREYEGKLYEMFSVGFVILKEGHPTWRKGTEPDYYLPSRVVTDLLQAAGIVVNRWQYRSIVDENPWQAGQAAVLGSFAEGYEAKFGLLNVGMTRHWDIESPVLAGAIYFFPEFLQKPRARQTYQPFSHFPPAIRDLAVVVPANLPAGKVEKAILDAAAKHAVESVTLESVSVFDIYKGPGLPEGHVSIACKLLFRHPDRTLTDKEVNAIFQSIQDKLDATDGMSVRK
ncbi:MAG TPA: hypothetical protein VK995_06250, partial [Oceanipulchritudo sp.]|nr:hypothetical protein [Oceanipulchritudo sp.]